MKFEQLVPSVFYADIKDSIPLFVDCLEFNITHQEFDSESPYYVIEKDGLGILVFQNKELSEKEKPLLRLVTKDIAAVCQKVSSTHPELLHPNLNRITLRYLQSDLSVASVLCSLVFFCHQFITWI